MWFSAIQKLKGGSGVTCFGWVRGLRRSNLAGDGTRCRAQTVIDQVLQESSTDGGFRPEGSLVFVLHSHIPYCRKAGMWPFGEEWLYEAMLESYIPLLGLLQGVSSHGPGAPGRSISLTLGITPILLDQLDDGYMREGFLKWADERLRRAESDRDRFGLAGDRVRERQAAEYCARYGSVIHAFRTEFAQDIAGAFGELQRRGIVELLTSAATHAYLPLLKEDTSIRGQLAAGCESYVRRFGCAPRGIWLPECAYRPGLEEYLQSLGLEYFFVDRHAVEGGEPIGVASAAERMANESVPAHRTNELGGPAGGGPTGSATLAARSTFRPYLVGRSDVTCFGRNERVTMQVWSSGLGYPGDGLYREFHRKDDVSGLQYWRVTSRDTDLGAKEPYDGCAAAARLKEHAAHFVGLVHGLVADWWASTKEHAVIVAPYDTELFGHWWYEGVAWLGEVLKGLSESSEVAAPRSAGKLLDLHPAQEAIELPESSWGRGGRHDVWLNDGTAWMWDIIHAAEARVKRLAALCALPEPPGEAPDARPHADILEGLKAQALREFFLLASSDWAFLVTERQATEYGAKRFREHAERLDMLMDYAERMLGTGVCVVGRDIYEPAPELPGKVSARPDRAVRPEPEDSDALIQEAAQRLAEIAEMDDPFPWLDFSVLSAKNL